QPAPDPQGFRFSNFRADPTEQKAPPHTLEHRVQRDSHKDIIKVRFICQGGLDRSVGEKPIALGWGICNMRPWGGEAGGGTGR
ncbi:unnamed protein product, partial [Rangifer tarandus platyrhynchus]